MGKPQVELDEPQDDLGNPQDRSEEQLDGFAELALRPGTSTLNPY